MYSSNDILSDVRAKEAEASRRTRRGLVLQPGAIGDCILTLPLIAFMREALGLGSVDIVGHAEYVGFLPGRSCVDGIRSIDLIDLHRLFAKAGTFDLGDGDPLISVFDSYGWIVTFLGDPDSDFEQNLTFTVYCSHNAEVITLPLKPPAKIASHISDFYIEQFSAQSGLELEGRAVRCDEVMIRATDADVGAGAELLEEHGIDPSQQLVVIHPGSGGLTKCWHLDNFLAVARELSLRDKQVLFLLGPAELERFSDSAIKAIEAEAKCMRDLSLEQVVAVLSRARGFVGNDSGITHLAAALGVRTVAVFGPTDRDVYRPIGPAVTTLLSDRSERFAESVSVQMQQRLLDALEA
jgi:hypothetical protein